jgi:anti-anti-sigma factor
MLDPGFHVHVAFEDAVAILRVRGEIDLFTAPVFDSHLSEVERLGGPVVVDLCALGFIDSGGIAALIRAHRRATEQQRRMAIACLPADAVGRALDVAGVSEMLPVFPSCAEALAGLRDG